MRSSEIARIAGVSTRALRHYHSIGLLDEPPRGENGYRDYDVMDLTRVLHIKRLAALGFSLAHIKDMLEGEQGSELGQDEQDSRSTMSKRESELEALDLLDRELEMQIERLQAKRDTIALLRKEQLDPSLPIRFARSVKKLYDNLPPDASAQATDNDRATILLAAHFYDERSLDELERFTDAATEKELLSPLYEIEKEIGSLDADSSEEQRARIVDRTMELLEPLITCFDPENWENSEDGDEVRLVDSMMKETLNPAQYDVEARIEAAILERIQGLGDRKPE